jgi:hypothetical protein
MLAPILNIVSERRRHYPGNVKVSVPVLYCQLMKGKGIVCGHVRRSPSKVLGTLESPEGIVA